MQPQKLLEGLFDKKRMVLVKLFLDHPDLEYGIREAARAARLAPATSYRIIHTLLKLGIVEERKVKKLRLYRLARSKETKFLDELLAVKKGAIEEFTERIREVPGVEEVILHGKPQKERASILVIGENVDSGLMARIEAEIKEQYGFTILHTLLSSGQYAQMNRMGLLGDEKQTLFKA